MSFFSEEALRHASFVPNVSATLFLQKKISFFF